MNVFFSQFIGFLAFIIFVISVQQKSKSKILFLQIVSFLFYALQYLLIQAYPGMIVFIINMIRSIAFYQSTKKQKTNKYLFFVFIFLSLICGIVTYEELFDILPIIAAVLSIIFTWQPSTKILRFGQIIICISWIIYDVFVLAYIGILTETIIIISTIIALLNLDYNLDLSKIIFKNYIKIKYRANDEIINFYPNLPRIKIIRRNRKKSK